MIIHPPVVDRVGSVVRVGALIEVERKPSLSREVWFEVPTAFESLVTAGVEPFVVGGLMLAMSLGEDVRVRGVVSSRLAYGLRQYQEYFSFWFARRLQVVDIEARLATGQQAGGARRVASFFSGGVDSLYTLRAHLPDRESIPAYRITHGVFVHGYDISLGDRSTYEALGDRYRAALHTVGVTLVPVRTNLRVLLDHSRVSWSMTHGTGLGAVGLLFGRTFGRCYIPSTQKYSITTPWGTNPIVDPLLSTEQLLFVHHGAHLARLAKTYEIGHWPVARRVLRVCWERPGGLSNCGRCEKCLRTMVALELAGVLSRCVTFPRLLRGSWRRWKLVTNYDFEYLAELRREAQRRGRADLVRRLEAVERRSRKRRLAYRWQRVLLARLWYGYRRLVDRVQRLVRREPSP